MSFKKGNKIRLGMKNSDPELRFNVNNGQTLCIPCHVKIDKYRGKNYAILR